ncbi:MAG: phosphate signaling complex protein PhoU [Phycisphaerales bacterium]|jgi:phosphate transport system protein
MNPQPEFHRPVGGSTLPRQIVVLKRQLIREASYAVAMIEQALDALLRLDRPQAKAVRKQDDVIDRNEIEIETACLDLLLMQHPVASDFRNVFFVLRVNTQVERVGDHASSIAKIASRMVKAGLEPRWPTSLIEMAHRVPACCHRTLRAVLDEDVQAAREIIEEDEVIDDLEKSLFAETLELIRTEPNGDLAGLYIYRVGRELERIADVMAGICRDLVFRETGENLRHT